MERTAAPDPLLTIRDRLAINDLLHAYCRHVDLLEVRELGQLFTDDCIVDYGPGLGGPHQGRDILEAALARGLRRFSATSHHLSNIRVTFQGRDRATASSYVFAWHRQLSDGRERKLFGRYFDDLVLTPEGWRIKRRRLRMAGHDGYPRVPGQDNPFELIPRKGRES